MMRRSSIWCFFLPFFVHQTLAQPPPPQMFQWGPTGPETLSEVAQCSNVSLQVQARSAGSELVGVPPYYLLAYEPNGVTTTSFLGTNASHLTWQVNHRAGASLILSVTDSQGNNGGTSLTTVNVTAPSKSFSNSCLPPPPSANITLTQTVKGKIATCDPVSIQISGGQKPYNVSIAATASSIVTNVTLGPDEDVFTYIERASPGVLLMLAVADATGQWGTSTTMLQTEGSTDTTCPGKVSLAGTALPSTATVQSGLSDVTKALIAVFTVLAVLVLALAIFLWRRRRERTRQETLPRFWSGDSPPDGSEKPGLRSTGSGSATATLVDHESELLTALKLDLDAASVTRANSALTTASQITIDTPIVANSRYANLDLKVSLPRPGVGPGFPRQPASSVGPTPLSSLAASATDSFPQSLPVPPYHKAPTRSASASEVGSVVSRSSGSVRAIKPAFPVRGRSLGAGTALSSNGPSASTAVSTLAQATALAAPSTSSSAAAPVGLTPAASAKAREAQAERERERQRQQQLASLSEALEPHSEEPELQIPTSAFRTEFGPQVRHAQASVVIASGGFVVPSPTEPRLGGDGAARSDGRRYSNDVPPPYEPDSTPLESPTAL